MVTGQGQLGGWHGTLLVVGVQTPQGSQGSGTHPDRERFTRTAIQPRWLPSTLPPPQHKQQ